MSRLKPRPCPAQRRLLPALDALCLRALQAYNTDWSAALDAVETGLGGARPLAGRRVVVLGAGGTGRALAFGAQQRGASVVIANRCAPRLTTLRPRCSIARQGLKLGLCMLGRSDAGGGALQSFRTCSASS